MALHLALSASPISASCAALGEQVFLDVLLESRDLAAQTPAGPLDSAERSAWIPSSDAKIEPFHEGRHRREAVMRLLSANREDEQAVVPVGRSLQLAVGFHAVGRAGEGLDAK